MIKVKRLNVGPIIGETTPVQVRLWGRADQDNSKDGIFKSIFSFFFGNSSSSTADKKIHGVARILDNDNEINITYFKMTELWDYTGVGILDGLEENKSYSYQIGWFENQTDTSELMATLPPLYWNDIATLTVKTASDKPDKARSYFIGSCRYNLPWTGDDKETSDTRGDKTFKTMIEYMETDGNTTDGLIMLGDQIYADIRRAGVETRKGYFRLYRGAFKQESLRSIMSKIPTYMTLDDHEIEDNWPSNREDDFSKVNAAKYAYLAYQLSHSPLLPTQLGRLNGIPQKFWYQHSDGCCDFFMMDSRTERIIGERMINSMQMDALEAFLLNANNKIKIIGTGVPFFPAGGDDTWNGFTTQRNRIIDFIKEKKVKKVIFISGDVHFSSYAEIGCKQDNNFKILSFTCSPFFWPFPHWADIDYDDISTDNFTYQVKGIDQGKEREFREENFVRLTLSPEKVIFKVFPRKNATNEEIKPKIDEEFTW